MSGFKDRPQDRQMAAEKARKAMQERFANRPGPDDPAMLEKRAARQAIAAAREVRRAEQEELRKKELQAQAERAAQLAVEEQQRREQDILDAQAKAAQEVALKAEQKAARDARYAARKARK